MTAQPVPRGPTPAAAERPRISRTRRRIIAAGVLAIVLLATARWILVPYRVQGDSMLPTLHGGAAAGAADFVLVYRLAYLFRAPARWDVVVVRRQEDAGHATVKRIAGLPGETVAIRNGRILVDGTPLRPPGSAGGTYVVSKGPFGFQPVVLGSDEYFLLGDNSYLSRDSRSWGPVHRGELQGRVVLICFPWRRMGRVR